jgi:16S rRNA (uracil1498-N3)-methyltransferase
VPVAAGGPAPDDERAALAGPAGAGAVAQVFVDDLEAPVLGDDDAHHLGRVLRLRAGEAVVAADGNGRWRLCRYGLGNGGEPMLRPEGPVAHAEPSREPVTVGFVPVKGDRPEWVVQKLTELGVDRLVVLRAARSVVRWEGERSERNLGRLRRVSREAAAQSRRAWLPEVLGPLGLEELAAAVAPQPLLLAEPGAPPLAERLTGPAAGPLPAVAVGPEGGWEAAELGKGAGTVGLGPSILRAETAAVAAATLLCALRDRV